MKTHRWTGLLALLAPLPALAAGAQLSIQQVETAQKRWPHARAYVNVIGASGSPIQGLSQDLFKVYEGGSADSSKVEKVDTLEMSAKAVSAERDINMFQLWFYQPA